MGRFQHVPLEKGAESLTAGAGEHLEATPTDPVIAEMSTLVTSCIFHTHHRQGAPGTPPRARLLMDEVTWEDFIKK